MTGTTEPGRMSVPVAVDEIYNYREAGPSLATSGQPREEQLAAIAAAGYEVIINLALHDDPRYSLRDEAASVTALGIEYVHIPVPFDAPTRIDLERFFEAMARHKHSRVWVHCAANLREKVRRGFCSVCGSTLFWEPMIEAYEYTSVAMGAFERPTGARLSKHIFVGDKGDYYDRRRTTAKPGLLMQLHAGVPPC